MTATLDWIVEAEIKNGVEDLISAPNLLKVIDGYDNKRVGYSWRKFRRLWDATIWKIRR